MSGARTLLLTASEIASLASVADHFDAAVAGFRGHAAGRTSLPAPMEIGATDGAFHVKGAAMAIDGEALAVVKVNGNFPLNPQRCGLPTIQGALFLSDASTGRLLAIMDSVEITLRRTAAASAVATDALALKSASTLLICGCGVQGRAHLEAIAPLRPLRQIFVFDADAEKARRFASEMTPVAGLPVQVAEDVGEAAVKSDIIVTTTPARTPLPLPSTLRTGTFVAAVGADNPAKNEIAPSLMANAVVITDVTDQCVAIGDLRAAIAAGAMKRSDVRASLGEVIAGMAPGRLSEDEVVIFDSTGAAFQDLTAASMIYKKARTQGVGAWISLQQ